jgi:hypothetical protein
MFNEFVSAVDATADSIMFDASAGVHTGTALNSFALITRPFGAGGSNPTADHAFAISDIKQNWTSTSQKGELEGFYLTARQGGPDGGGSDMSAVLVDAVNLGTVGFMAAVDTSVIQLNRGSFTLNRSLGVRLGVIDTVPGKSYGVTIQPRSTPQTIDYGVYIADDNLATISFPFWYAGQNNAFFRVDFAGGEQISGDLQALKFTGASSVPTANVCTGASFVTGSSDVQGVVGLTSAASCSLKFGTAFLNQPACTVAPGTAQATAIVSPTTTQVSFTFSASQTSFSYHCLGI